MENPICIIGAGPVGVTLAVLLSQQREVCLISKRELPSAQPSITGALNLEASKTLRKLLVYQAEQIPARSEIWLCTRAFDLRDAVKQFMPQILNSSGVSILSNGLGIFLDAAFDIGREIPMARTLLSFGAKLEAENQARLAGELVASVSSMAEHSAYADSTETLLKDMNFRVSREVDVATAEWRKAVTNIIVNSLCTVADVHNGAVLEDPELRSSAAEMFREVKLVMEADGFEFPELTEKVFFDSIVPHAENINSTLAALRAGNKTESDFFIGRFLKIAEGQGIKVPAVSKAAEELAIQNYSK